MSSSFNSHKPVGYGKKSTLESLSDVGSSMVNRTANGMKDMGMSMFDQLLGKYEAEKQKKQERQEIKRPKPEKKAPVEIFNFKQEQDNKTIERLLNEVKQEMKMLEKADKSFMNEVKDVEKLTITTSREQTGLYNIRFLEVVIKMIRMLRVKVSESRSWLHTYNAKRARGSAYASRKAKSGTSYSQSQELTMGHPSM